MNRNETKLYLNSRVKSLFFFFLFLWCNGNGGLTRHWLHGRMVYIRMMMIRWLVRHNVGMIQIGILVARVGVSPE